MPVATWHKAQSSAATTSGRMWSCDWWSAKPSWAAMNSPTTKAHSRGLTQRRGDLSVNC